ncbi:MULTISPECIES: hypothetical protein [Sphaerospermopsis]|jgi:hypothetical protein|uniref:Uncharacterized protein n=1 Tax=Sphaerospermopsis aphanizomenoides LEGE 00250 TaxID=2777972 RepID=A0ABR9VJM9_9CYAN|nr:MULTISPECIES: hypothetical protein [Sphaerospermopsis]MBD2146756.1 hypothetical protein [Sphaerospermopsis sp. FACHB-1194]MBE9238709.1 hypothetical protein [Sphaerospermopsis aphanizomenoides LEGE 00250]
MAVQSGDQNLLVLMVYILGVYYTFNRMIESVDDMVVLNFQKSAVEEQLKEQNLDEKIGISFKTDTYSLEKLKDNLKELSISIDNKSEALAVYVDWDNSSWVIEHSKKSRRVIRKSPDLSRDLAIPQVPTIIAPKKTISESVTAEDILKRDKETGTYQPGEPLIDIVAMKDQKPFKGLYKDFMDGKKKVEFSFQLVLRISELRVGLAPGVNVPPISIINCPFTIEKLPWTYALPWNKTR